MVNTPPIFPPESLPHYTPGRKFPFPANRPQQADKLRTQQELERLQAKYIGTGHPDTTSWEWKTNIHRDTSASIVGHPPLLAFVALAQNEPIAKVRARIIRVNAALPNPCLFSLYYFAHNSLT